MVIHSESSAFTCPVAVACSTSAETASDYLFDMIAQLDVRIGDAVFIQKAGEIIPQVIGVDHTARHDDRPRFAMPPICPICGTPVASRLRDEADPEGGSEATVRCPNRECPAQVKGQIFYFARRFAMDVDHLGIALEADAVAREALAAVALASRGVAGFGAGFGLAG